MRTKQEIESEITSLKALKPAAGRLKESTKRQIELAVEELEHGFDDTAEEWDELTHSEQDIIKVARRWKEGGREKPSEGWGKLVE